MVDSKGGIRMCKLKRLMHKAGHYDVENERVDGKGGIMCKIKLWMDKGGHYDVQIKRVDG